MIVGEVFDIRDRGPVACVRYDADVLPSPGDKVRRLSDGAVWELRGVEKFAVYRSSWRGIDIGLLLPRGATLTTGDEIVIEEASDG